MNVIRIHHRHFIDLLAACLFALPGLSAAQQNPLTGQMMGGRSDVPVAAATDTMPLRDAAASSRSPAPTPPQGLPPAAYAPAPRAVGDAVGDTTRRLLEMQADDNRPGTRLPMLGDEASASYDRYLKSFTHPIPEFFEPSVGSNGSGSGNSGR